MFRRKEKYEIKTFDEFLKMRRAGLVVADTLQRISVEAIPGVTTKDLDRIAREELIKFNATPSFLGYYGYPAVICTSVNDEVVHAIPNERALVDGDIVSVDFGAIVDGWHGDSAVTIEIGTKIPAQSKLSSVTKAAMWAGVGKAVAGNHLSDISNAVEKIIRTSGDYGILEDYTGHGIGTKMHMEPSIPNFGAPGNGPKLVVGMALAIEPMVTLGTKEVHTLSDNWTVVTDDGTKASHWEHTVAITEDGPWVLTAHDGGAQYFKENGISSPAERL